MAAIAQSTRNTSLKNSKDYSNSSLQKSAKYLLILAQCFALFPVYGITSKDIGHIKFKWISWKVAYTFANLLGSSVLAFMNFLRFLRTGMHFGDLGNDIIIMYDAMLDKKPHF